MKKILLKITKLFLVLVPIIIISYGLTFLLQFPFPTHVRCGGTASESEPEEGTITISHWEGMCYSKERVVNNIIFWTILLLILFFIAKFLISRIRKGLVRS